MKPTHGGVRKGAGRPASGRVPVTIRLTPEAIRILKRSAKEMLLTLSERAEMEIMKIKI